MGVLRPPPLLALLLIGEGMRKPVALHRKEPTRSGQPPVVVSCWVPFPLACAEVVFAFMVCKLQYYAVVCRMVSNNMVQHVRIKGTIWGGRDDGPSSSSPVRALRPDVVHPVLSQWSSAGCSRSVSMYVWAKVMVVGDTIWCMSRPKIRQKVIERENLPVASKKSKRTQWGNGKLLHRVHEHLLNFETHYPWKSTIWDVWHPFPVFVCPTTAPWLPRFVVEGAWRKISSSAEPSRSLSLAPASNFILMIHSSFTTHSQFTHSSLTRQKIQLIARCVKDPVVT